MVKAAPGLFSMMIFWLRTCSISAATERAQQVGGAAGRLRDDQADRPVGKLPCAVASAGNIAHRANDSERRKHPRAQT